MSWRALLSSVWARALVLPVAVVLLTVGLTADGAKGACSKAPACQACHDGCCPAPQGMCSADAPHHAVFTAPESPAPSFRSFPLSALAAAPWQVSAPAVGLPPRCAAGFPADPGRFSGGPSRPQLGVWLI